MRVEYHPAVAQDVLEAVRHYDAVSLRLGAEFSSELQEAIAAAAANPGRFHLIRTGFHRANLRRFPFHIIYRELPDGIRVTLVRHHRRNPSFGMQRS